MKKILWFLFVVLDLTMVAAISNAQPNLRTKSARLETLQLNVGLEDETNVIGLDFFGNNPAGLVLDEKKSRAAAVLSHNKVEDKVAAEKVKTVLPGVYGVKKFEKQAVGVQLNTLMIDADSDNEEFRETFANLLYSAQPNENLVIGGNIGYLDVTDKGDSFDKITANSDPADMGIGLGLIAPHATGRFILGANYHLMNTEVSQAGSMDTDVKDKALNFTAIFQSALFDFGAGYTDEIIEPEDDQEIDAMALQGRLLFRPNAPWRLGAKAAVASQDANLSYVDLNIVTFDVGVTWLFGERGLIGVNFFNEQGDIDHFDIHNQKTSFGAEFAFTNLFIGRASYGFGKNESEDLVSSIETDVTTYGVGGGLKFNERGKIDLGWLHNNEEYLHMPLVHNSEDTVELVGTLYF